MLQQQVVDAERYKWYLAVGLDFDVVLSVRRIIAHAARIKGAAAHSPWSLRPLVGRGLT